MKINTASPKSAVAIALGLTLTRDARSSTPRGPCGQVEWEAPEGLLSIVPGSEWSDPEAGSGRVLKVERGDHAGRHVVVYDGSAWFRPSVRWEPSAQMLEDWHGM